MLVLARHLNESIMIGDEIEIVVVAVSSDQVKLGIRAPRSVAVHRKEVFEEIQREMKLAAAAKGDAARGAELLKKAFPRPGGASPAQGPQSPTSPPSAPGKDPSRRGERRVVPFSPPGDLSPFSAHRIAFMREETRPRRRKMV